MTTQFSNNVLLLVGMLRTGNISQGELLQGIRFARISSSRSAAEREAKTWFEINGALTRHTREFYLAVGYLVKFRLASKKSPFSTLVVRILMSAGISVAEAEKVLDFTREYFAGALELIRLHEEGKISEAEVDEGIVIAYRAKDAEEAASLARDLLKKSRKGTDTTLAEFVFCIVCLWSIGGQSVTGMRYTVEAIQQAVYAAEGRSLAVIVSPNIVDPSIMAPLVIRTETKLWYLGFPDADGYRDVAVTPFTSEEKPFPASRASIAGSGYNLGGGISMSSTIIEIGVPMILKPWRSSDDGLLWATAPVVEVEIL